MPVFNGVRYCGKLAELSFKDSIRPVKLEGGNYECPSGFTSCNKDALDLPNGEDYVTCRRDEDKEEAAYPITAIDFDVSDNKFKSLYERIRIDSSRANDPRGFYISRKVLQQGVLPLKVQPGVPCVDSYLFIFVFVFVCFVTKTLGLWHVWVLVFFFLKKH